MRKSSRRSQAPLAVLFVLAVPGCSSLGPCALYDCPRIEVRSGDQCREAWIVNPGKVAKIYSLREVCPDKDGLPLPGEVITRDGTIAAGDEIPLGCVGGGCWYDLFDVKDIAEEAAPPTTPEEKAETRKSYLAGVDRAPEAHTRPRRRAS